MAGEPHPGRPLPAPLRIVRPFMVPTVPTREQQDAKERHNFLTFLCTLGGVVFLFVGFSTLFMDGAASVMEALTAIAQMLGGGAALLTGLHMKRTRQLERQLDKIVGDRDNIPLDELFAAAGVDQAKGRSAVEKRHRARLFRSRCLHRQPHRHAGGAGRSTAAEKASTRSGTQAPARRRGRVRCTAAPAAGSERCHS